MTPKCGDCLHSKQNEVTEDLVYCIRKPPSVFPYVDEGVLKFISAFPTLTKDKVCGKFEPRPTALH